MRTLGSLGCCAGIGLGLLGCGPVAPVDEGDTGPLTQEDLPSFVRTFGSSNAESVTALSLGPDGEVMFGGRYAGTINLGGGYLQADGTNSLYLAELAADGSHIWSATTGSYDDEITGVSMGPAGGMAVSASFNGFINFGSGVHEGERDGVFATFDDDATPLHSRSFETPAPERADDILLTKDRHVRLLLSTAVPIDLGLGEIPGYWSAIVEFDETGHLLWQLPFTTGSYPSNGRLAADSDGNIYLAGSAYQVLTIGDVSLTANAYVAKVAPDGSLLWARGAYAEDGWAEQADVAVGPDGEAVVSGRFYGTLNVAGSLQTAGDLHSFVIRYDRDGNNTMVRHWKNEISYEDAFVGVGPDGDIWAFGAFSGEMDIGDGQPLFEGTSVDLYLARFTAEGAPVSAEQIGGIEWERAEGLAIDAVGQPVIAGTFTSVFSVGALSFTTESGHARSFVARLPAQAR